VIRRLPVIPTIIVGIAVAAMIALGVWQLQRMDEKEALIALYRANLGKPAMTFPELAPVPREAMFRSSSVLCLEVVGWRIHGSRRIAECRTGAEGPGALVDMGFTPDPAFKPKWAGGEARGTIVTEPDTTSLIGRMFGRGEVPSPMLVSSEPAPGLKASQPPTPESVPNNHLAYAVQWFLFAAIALLIYGLALRQRVPKP
jgi:surfeit locus 1 family protein